MADLCGVVPHRDNRLGVAFSRRFTSSAVFEFSAADLDDDDRRHCGRRASAWLFVSVCHSLALNHCHLHICLDCRCRFGQLHEIPTTHDHCLGDWSFWFEHCWCDFAGCRS